MKGNWIIIIVAALALLVVGYLVVSLHSSSEKELIFQVQEYQTLNAHHVASKLESFFGNQWLSSEAVVTSQSLLGDAMNDLQTDIHHRVWIMDTDGNLLFHSEHPETPPGNIYQRDKNCNQCHVSFAYVEKILKERQGATCFEIRNRKKVVAFVPMEFGNASWIVVVDSDYDRVASVIRKSLQDHLMLLGIVILAVVSSSVLLSRNIRSKVRAEEEVKHWRQVVAERKDAEETLQKSEERYRNLVETMTEGLAVQDNKGILSYANDRFCEMLGYNRDELVGQPADSFIDISNQGIFEDHPDKGNGREHPSYEIVLKKKDGNNIYALSSSKSIIDLDGHLTAKFAVVTDITMRKQMEEGLKNSWRQLKLLSFKILTAQETERRRISRELHDELGGTINGLRFKFRYVAKQLQEEQIELRMECEDCARYLDRMIEEIRRICRDLSPSILENLGFAAALRWLVDNFVKIHNVKVFVDAVEIEHLFSTDAQLIIYRILQEALGNIGKHAQAANITIRIKEWNKTVSFFIEDDGKGFDANQVFNRDTMEGGLGLGILQERVQMLRGTFDLRSEEGRGTKITFCIPIEKEPIPYGQVSHLNSR